MQRIYDFLKKCDVYYLATIDGDQPRVRPFGTVLQFDGKLYVLTGKVKQVYRQLVANPKVELCAFDGKDTWLRVQATLVNDPCVEVKQRMLDDYPMLQAMYSTTDDNTQVLYLKDAVATFLSFDGTSSVIEFGG